MRSIFVMFISQLGLAGLIAAPPGTPQPPSIAPGPAPDHPAATATDEGVLLTNGWALLAQGLPNDAASRASEAVARNPRSIAAASLLIETDIARAGFSQGLKTYEQWLRGRALEEPGLLRRLAVALLSDAAGRRNNALARHDAIVALAEGGESWARQQLAESSVAADQRTLAGLGDERAVAQLSAQLEAHSPDKVAILDALGTSKQPAAAEAVGTQLTDPREEVRAAAADALAELRADTYVPQLRQALEDSSSFVRTRAARALFRMGDMSGLALLQQLSTSDTDVSRLIAAEAMATTPDAGWQELVRSLTSSPEPEVRAGAARLLAPYDPALARSVLQTLMDDPNIAIRELAGRSLGDSLNAEDLAGLRRLMGNADPLTRIHAAGAVLKATL